MSENNPIISSVITKLHKQQEKGLKKYGVEVKTSSHDLKEWLQHGLEETLDLATYLETAIQLLKEQEQAFQARYDHHISLKNECIGHDYDDPENRDTDILIHSENASAVYQIAKSLGFTLKTEGE
ncbi:hypothetical protein [Bacillus pumilus]|uniref:hypothetical protein n=1 Tax=Bacillus pumilus TaxID=1408 RepID=UPI0021B5C0F4|nr:hypothetical protein [Bacillus pumilus]